MTRRSNLFPTDQAHHDLLRLSFAVDRDEHLDPSRGERVRVQVQQQVVGFPLAGGGRAVGDGFLLSALHLLLQVPLFRKYETRSPSAVYDVHAYSELGMLALRISFAT